MVQDKKGKKGKAGKAGKGSKNNYKQFGGLGFPSMPSFENIPSLLGMALIAILLLYTGNIIPLVIYIGCLYVAFGIMGFEIKEISKFINILIKYMLQVIIFILNFGTLIFTNINFVILILYLLIIYQIVYVSVVSFNICKCGPKSNPLMFILFPSIFIILLFVQKFVESPIARIILLIIMLICNSLYMYYIELYLKHMENLNKSEFPDCYDCNNKPTRYSLLNIFNKYLFNYVLKTLVFIISLCIINLIISSKFETSLLFDHGIFFNDNVDTDTISFF